MTRKRPADYWVERLEEAGTPCGPILSVDQVFDDPQVKHLRMAAPVDHPRLGPTHMVDSPINLEGLATDIRSVAPLSCPATPTPYLSEIKPLCACARDHVAMRGRTRFSDIWRILAGRLASSRPATASGPRP